MTTKLTLPSDITDEQAQHIFSRFTEETNSLLNEYILTEDSSCGKYEYIYLFMSVEQEMSLLSILKENQIKVIEREDFTAELLEVVNRNKTEEFKQRLSEEFDTFDIIIKEFIDENVEKDHVLDKMLDLGKDALTEQDMAILNS